MIARLAACLLLFSLSACMPSFKSSTPPPGIYTLQPAAGTYREASPANVISIPEPSIPAGFDTEKIVLHMNGGRQLDYYADAVWPDRLSTTLHSMLVQSARKRKNFTVTGHDAPYMLFVDVNDFQPIYAHAPDTPPVVKVSINFRLISEREQNLIMNQTFSSQLNASANTQTAVITALASALQKVVAQAYGRIDSLLEPAKNQERMPKVIPQKTTDEGERR